ncbi:MAG: hypothetical protein C5B51_24770 [Terriglobia bacterium]|nr:MAG: hypothetical protein C5B51_24770 [Terriglobia bacterium]
MGEAGGPAELARYIIRLLSARSLLVLSVNDSSISGCADLGVKTRCCSFSIRSLSELDNSYDATLCMELPSLAPDEYAAVAAAIAGRSRRVVLVWRPDCSSSPWLRAFEAAGLGVDLSFEGAWNDGALVLLRPEINRGDLSGVITEILSLRYRLAQTIEARERESAYQEKAELRLAQLHARTNQVSHTLHTLVNSRIWRTLVMAGGVALNLQKLSGRLLGRSMVVPSDNGSNGDSQVQVHCDQPRAEVWGQPAGISGHLRVKGWALSPAGMQRVELLLGDQPPVQARYGLYRPDIKARFSGVPRAAESGFQGSIDTGPLPNGHHILTIRAVSNADDVAQVQVQVTVDHVHGYADEYHRWIKEFEKRDAAEIAVKLSRFTSRPLISVIVPVYRTPLAILEKTISSVLRQSYPNWELCVADDCSGSEEISLLLDRYAASDKRIKVVHLPDRGGISAASNAALECATGEWIGLLDHDDELAQDALFHVVDALHHQPEADILYSDEDHLDEEGLRSDPFFKPDWSPDLILGENYVCHFMVLRASLCLEIGGFRSEMDLSQDFDILLRASRKARRIVHIPKILYHWRTNVYTVSRVSETQQNRALESSRRSIEDHLRSVGTPATVEPGAVPTRWRIRYPIPKGQSVRILVPCGGKIELLERCLNSVVDKTDYDLFGIVVIDNSPGDRVERFTRNWSRRGRNAGYVDYRGRPFNFSAMNNVAAKDVSDPLLLFLNDDITVINADWLAAMVELASRPEVGAVGAKLLYPDGTIQHAGLVTGIFGTCGHAFKGAFGEDRIYFDFPHLIRNVSAVTGACMMVSTEKFWSCGGFDADALPVAYNDVDLCLKLEAKGYRILYTPHAQLYHYEALSKRASDKDPRPAETLTFQTRWKEALERDPFYSPNLTVAAEDYSYRTRLL